MSWLHEKEGDLHKEKPAICICIQKKITHMHIFMGSPFNFMKSMTTFFNFHIFLSPLKTSANLSSITKKGDIVSASSATLSWFWSIDEKHC